MTNDPALDRYRESLTEVLTEHEEITDHVPYYVQSVTIAAFGEPVMSLRWNAETQGYDVVSDQGETL